MANPQEAWFEKTRPEVSGFEFEECPHGFLKFEQQHNRTDASYSCTECGKTFVAKTIEEDEE